jgi:hypothetical protein
MNRPEKNEFADYYHTYITHVPDGDIASILERQIDKTVQDLEGLGEERAMQRYAPGKWTIKEVVGHLIDAERMFAYRALCFSRNEKKHLPSFEQNDYVENANFNDHSLQDLLEEFRLLRSSNVALFRSFSDEMMMRTGMASGFKFTVRAIAHVIAGHELHHRNVIKERYLQSFSRT